MLNVPKKNPKVRVSSAIRKSWVARPNGSNSARTASMRNTILPAADVVSMRSVSEARSAPAFSESYFEYGLMRRELQRL